MPGNLANIPPSVVASWPTPNYVDPVARTWLPAFSVAWQIASTILVWGRFYLRARKQAGPFGLDDAFILVAWLLSIGLTTCACLASFHYGLDRHTWDVPPGDFPNAVLACIPKLIARRTFVLILYQTGFLAQNMFNFSSCSTKISVLLFYRRLVTDTTSRVWKYAIYLALGFTAVYTFGVFVALVTICTPLHAYWKVYDLSWHRPYHCTDTFALNYVIGILSVISDFYAVALPCVILQHYQLNVPRRQKIALNLVFGLGSLVAGAGIARTYFLVRLGTSYDTSWTGFDLYVWSLVECQLGIICASAPSMRAFFRRYLSGHINRTILSSNWSKNLSAKFSRSSGSGSTPRGNSRRGMVSPQQAAEQIDHPVLAKPALVATEQIELGSAPARGVQKEPEYSCEQSEDHYTPCRFNRAPFLREDVERAGPGTAR